VIENIPRKIQVYPYTWEVFLDDVFLDGVRLPRSQLSTPDIQLSALIDTVRFIYLYPVSWLLLITIRETHLSVDPLTSLTLSLPY
jgi:hypothetical protein